MERKTTRRGFFAGSGILIVPICYLLTRGFWNLWREAHPRRPAQPPTEAELEEYRKTLVEVIDPRGVHWRMGEVEAAHRILQGWRLAEP